MGIAAPACSPPSHEDRVGQTAALLARRGYALSPANLGDVCLAGILQSEDVVAALRGAGLELRAGLVVSPSQASRAEGIAARAACHLSAERRYLPSTLRFIRRLVAVAPYVLSVSIAGSLASGGFVESDDVDLNLVVEDGHRYLAYVVLNLLAILHAARYRRKPVDDLTRRPLVPRLITANLVLERSQCFPLARQDEDMAFELLQARPVFGRAFMATVVAANPRLLDHFPQLESRYAGSDALPPRLPALLFPPLLDGPARALGRAAWRYMQWTRRHRPAAVARVRYVRSTMRPYALFDD